MDSNKPESQILSWVESQENSEQIFEYFNKFMQGYVGQEKKKSPKR